MQELFFCVIAAFAELFTAMIWKSFLVVMYSTNWEFMMYIRYYIGNGKIAK